MAQIYFKIFVFFFFFLHERAILIKAPPPSLYMKNYSNSHDKENDHPKVTINVLHIFGCSQ